MRRCCVRALSMFPQDEPMCAMDRAFALSVLGRTLTLQREFGAAHSAIEEALSLYRKAFGKNHPFAANNLIKTADILMEEGQAKRAREWLEEARGIYITCLGPEAVGVARCYKKTRRHLCPRGTRPGGTPIFKKSL
jgi:hypothetical protein